MTMIEKTMKLSVDLVEDIFTSQANVRHCKWCESIDYQHMDYCAFVKLANRILEEGEDFTGKELYTAVKDALLKANC